jgi:hypothetical protein
MKRGRKKKLSAYAEYLKKAQAKGDLDNIDSRSDMLVSRHLRGGIPKKIWKYI